MNLFPVLRGIASLALPLAFVLGGRHRPSNRHRPAPVDGSSTTDAPVPSRRRLGRRALRTFVLAGGDLDGIELRHARLSGLALAGVDLTGRDLTGATLTNVDFSGASLDGCRLDFASCVGARFRGVVFDGVSLLDTDLSSADLRGADLRGARQLVTANLKRTVADRHTRWPGGRDPRPGRLGP